MSTIAMRGIGASPGIAIGPIYRYEIRQLSVELQHIEDPQAEAACLDAALQQARQEVHVLFTQAQQEVGAQEAAIFEAHEMFLEDPELLQQAHATIKEQRVNAAYAWQEGTRAYIEQLRALDDEYMAARAVDLEDVAQRVLRALLGVADQQLHFTDPVILVAHDLTPSETIRFDSKKILAFCTAVGGPTSHVAILAKALNIPAVTGIDAALIKLDAGAETIVDGSTGEIFVRPEADLLARYRTQSQAQAQNWQVAFQQTQRAATTLDGINIEVVANIGDPEHVTDALKYGAEGVGLLRTEFLFMERATAPTEDEQYTIYQKILQQMEQRPVVVRTFDIGGDKPAAYMQMAGEMNPFLGVRGIRLALEQTELFRTQLRALLRAGVGHTLRLMFPMVTNREEICAIREQVDRARASLEVQGQTYAKNVELGIMIEVPAAAIMADGLVDLVDFFSIGTNDLTQYTLAVDRTNAAVAPLADALHPAVLRLIAMVIDAAHSYHKWVGLCGELAGEPLAVPILLGLGLDEWSMTARSIPLIKQKIRLYSVTEARTIMSHALHLRNAAEVRAYLQTVAR